MVTEDSEYLPRYRDLGLSGVPCSVEEVEALEANMRVTLPAAYRAYLLLMGQSPDPVLTGTNCSIRDAYELRTAGDDLLVENGCPFELPPEAFVFAMHQGYQFMFFNCDGTSENPPIFYYLEGYNEPVLKFTRFSDWVELCASEKGERA